MRYNAGLFMSNVTIQSRVHPSLKQDAEAVFAAIGLSTSDAIRMFLQQSVNVGGLPFRPVAKQPNAETLAAMRELEEGGGKHFDSIEAMLKDLDD
jgi:DNA-damage-inducible protein J